MRKPRQVPPSRTARQPAAPAAPKRWRRWTAGAVAAGILAVGAATATFVVQEQRVREAERIQAVLVAPDAVTRTATVDGGGEVSMTMSGSRDAGVVLVSGLSTPDGQHAYQLWLVRGSTPTSAGLLDAHRRRPGRGPHPLIVSIARRPACRRGGGMRDAPLVGLARLSQ